jgi:hypothetical protein
MGILTFKVQGTVFKNLYPLLAQFKCQLCARPCPFVHSRPATDTHCHVLKRRSCPLEVNSMLEIIQTATNDAHMNTMKDTIYTNAK